MSVFKYRYLQLCIKCENGLPYILTYLWGAPALAASLLDCIPLGLVAVNIQ